MIRINSEHQGLIGDALCAVPYMKYLCDINNCAAIVVGNYNTLVQELVKDYPFFFSTECTLTTSETYELDLSSAWQLNFRNNWRWHMGQVYHAYYEQPIPSLPITFPMHREPCGLIPGIVITPFTNTNNVKDNNKLWPHARWIKLIRYLLARYDVKEAHVLGTTKDDFSHYENKEGINLVIDRPLPQILDLLQRTYLVLGLDNGVSHLTHFAGVSRHIMIYANCLPPRFAENPAGVCVRGEFPIDITIDQVIYEAVKILDMQCAD